MFQIFQNEICSHAEQRIVYRPIIGDITGCHKQFLPLLWFSQIL